ncbi:hypothetical protein OCH239_10380 [Roseivivax halodurans JCM 10272]|uniref:Uncharacterized protein n=1 Tax=Roseivivax halodurans JCM 10272 TaxID=1449350 RepID=X7EC74_9RHOB|nr:hypothetical protein [Roseivivax halodurans]ETX13445.1 hypothetical protein OCH239_10380 [Roseivivax halodurans JCM 10272]
MTPKTFSVDMRRDGGARLALSYRAADRGGIQRLACDIAAADLVRVVLLVETLGLQEALGAPVAAELDIDGLQIATDGTGDGIRLVRQQGYNSQEARMELATFSCEMSGITEACLARAAESKHGPVLTGMLEECPMPEAIASVMDEDGAEQVYHVIREMALLILAEEAETKGSELARKLRAKKRREDAYADVCAALDALSAAFLPPVAGGAPTAEMRRRG